MRPDISLGQEVDGELHARGLSPTAAARAIAVPDRTLRSQLSGRHEDGKGLRDPFRNIGLGALHAPDLDLGESALLAQAREVGIAWALAHLVVTSPADLVRLQGALAKAAASRMLYSPTDWLTAAWVPLVEDLKLRLLYAEDEEGEAVHWSWPGAEVEDEGTAP